MRHEDQRISIDQALIMALKMHDRGHCNLFRAILTGLQLRYQLNFLGELGVSLDYPTVIRWPFEKVTFVNNKAHLIRVHEKLYHHTPEIKEKTDSIQMNSVNYILQESEGL